MESIKIRSKPSTAYKLFLGSFFQDTFDRWTNGFVGAMDTTDPAAWATFALI